MMKPLQGLRVLDFTQFVSGPYCTLILADLGAEVIKIERPDTGDVYRGVGPRFIKGQSSSFLALNRNKKSLALNLKSPKSVTIIEQLIRSTDILVENSRVGTMDKLGLGYTHLSSINPRLIYAAITAYGSTGPKREQGGFDLILQGETGIMSMTGHPNTPPAKIPVAALDFGAGMNGVIGILAAVIERQQMNQGRFIDTSLLDCAISWLGMHLMDMFAGGASPSPAGTASHFFAPYQAFQTADSYIIIVGTGNPQAWLNLCHALGAPELIDDLRFRTNTDRLANLSDLVTVLESKFRLAPTDHWLNILDEAGVVCGPVNRLDDVLRDPQVLARGMLPETEHPIAGTLRMSGNPVKFYGTTEDIAAPPPMLGQHTDEILSDLGYSLDQIDSLRAEKIVL